MSHEIRRGTLPGALTFAALAAAFVLWSCGSSFETVASKSVEADSTSSPAVGFVGDASAFDELVIVESGRAAPTGTTRPGDTEGGLRARIGEEKTVPLPLEHTDVRARISAFVASVDVTQRYHNPFDTKIEAVYVFPLPQNAAVTDFVMVIGERRIRGLIREREEARRLYEQAKRQGHVASLLTQERPNIFTQSVANIEPGKRIDVNITYFHTLPHRDGEYAFVFPTVVGPRYIPGAPTTDDTDRRGPFLTNRVPDADRITPPALKPDERSPHEVSVKVELDAGIPLESISCRTHVVDIDRTGPSTAVVTLSPNDAVPNKDLVLRYRVAADRARAAFLTSPAEDGGTFAILVQPPADLATLPRVPREMVFVLDCSGSMNGRPIEIAKEAVARCLRQLGEDDTFQIIQFSMDASALGDEPLPATPRNVRRGLSYLNRLQGEGGTQMIEGIKAALEFPHDPRRYRIVSFWTDGYIGNETEIFAAIRKRLGAARIFSFGIGSSVNRYLLEGMARMGRGVVSYVGLNESSVEAIDGFYRRAARPALTDLAIDWGGLDARDVYPRTLPDLFVGRPLLVTGRYRGTAPTTVRVTGQAAGRDRALALAFDPTDGERRHPALPKVWARRKLSHLADLLALQPSDELRDEMIAVSIENGVQCAYTAFLAIDSANVTAGDHGVTVPVPVPVPEGVKYETTIK